MAIDTFAAIPELDLAGCLLARLQDRHHARDLVRCFEEDKRANGMENLLVRRAVEIIVDHTNRTGAATRQTLDKFKTVFSIRAF